MNRARLDDVALSAGVSTKTVSRVLNGSAQVSPATRARVEAAVAELGFVPNPQARALALGHSTTVALAYGATPPAVVSAVMKALLDVLAESAFVLAPCPLGDDPVSSLARFVERHHPAGVLLLGPAAPKGGGDLAALCRKASLPLQQIGPGGEWDVGALAPHDRRAMAGLVAWLVSLGHRRIGLVAGPENSPAARQRELGYLDAMAEHGLDRGPALIVAGDDSFVSGLEAGLLMLELSPRPSAIIAAHDEMAAGLIHAAARRGLSVPGDLSVAGFDDTPLAAQLWPPLTSMGVPWPAMARAALARLMPGVCAAEPGDPDCIPDLAVRDSVGEAPPEARSRPRLAVIPPEPAPTLRAPYATAPTGGSPRDQSG